MTDPISALTGLDDCVSRFVFEQSNLRGEIITLAQTLTAPLAQQQLPEPVADMLGEFFAATLLLAETLKFDGTLTLQARGDGPLPLIMAEATNERTLRGIAKPSERTTAWPSTLKGMVGNGVLTITMDPRHGQRYQGIVPLDEASLSECLDAYFAQSEQLPSRFWLTAKDGRAAGLLLQALPPTASHPAREDDWQTAVTLTETVKQQELLRLSHTELLRRLYHEMPVRLFEPNPVRFACSCSAERSLNALAALGREDAHSLLLERGAIEMNCEFCGAHYRFGDADLQELFGPGITH